MIRIDKATIEQQYKNAILTYKGAVSENERFRAMREMAELERSAMEQYGFEYADKLSELKDVIEEVERA